MKQQIIYIPYHQKVDEVCDFVFQTISILLKRGFVVKIILYDYAYIFGDPYNYEYFSDAYHTLLKHPRFSVIRPLFYMRSRQGLRRLYKLNREIEVRRLVSIMSLSQNNVLWVFWPEDVDLVVYVKNQYPQMTCVYDCVDYFTSTNPILSQVIQKQEAILAKSVDYVFINSIAWVRQSTV